ncbi:MAG: hypothetical protein FJ299_11905 [Planctomycetes bacterium]|nr:hypothetical protein [Planctomycetota bacterium]
MSIALSRLPRTPLDLAQAPAALRSSIQPVLQPGGLPLAARSAILCAACLWVGLLTLELIADNHERALELHERQRDLVAREALNQRLAFLAESHVPGVGTRAPAEIERAGPPASKVAQQSLAKASGAQAATRKAPPKPNQKPNSKAAPKANSSAGSKSKPAPLANRSKPAPKRQGSGVL